MRRALKYLGIAGGGLLGAAALAAVYVQVRGIPRYPVEALELVVDATPERLAHGRGLVSMLCASCHLDPATKALSGKRMPDAPPEFGVIHAPNITRHPEHGIGRWSDGELVYLLRTGIARDGHFTPPYMPKLPRASDEDIAAIVAFLRSDDPLVRPLDVPSQPSQVTFLTKLLTRVAWQPLPLPRQPIAAPTLSDRVERGRYLANDLLDCYACHSSDFTKLDPLQPERSAGFFEGGNKLLDAAGRVIYSTNLTPDPETGIGSWSEGAFVRALKGGLRPDGGTILYPMQLYTALADADAAAIYAYLRTLPAVSRQRPPSPAHELARAESEGQRVYNERHCTSCHGKEGVGLYDLRRALARYPSDEELVAFIKQPAARVPGIAMPAWAGVIPERDYPPLVAYVRSLQLPEASR